MTMNRPMRAWTLSLALAGAAWAGSASEPQGAEAYCQAWSLWRSGKPGAAAARFLEVRGTLEPWARARAARARQEAGDGAGAEALLEPGDDLARVAPLTGLVLETRARCRAARGSHAEAARLMAESFAHARPATEELAARVWLADRWFEAGSPAQGFAALLDCLDRPGESSAAKRDVMKRLLTDHEKDRVTRALATADLLRWARFLAGRGRLSEALTALGRLDLSADRDPCKVGLAEARWASQLGRRDQASALLARLADDPALSKECRAEALLTLIRVQAAGNDAVSGRYALGRLLELETGSGRVAAARLELADLEDAAGRRREAEALRALVIEQQPQTASAAGLIWKKGMAAYEGRRYSEAEKHFALYAKHHSDRRLGPTARYWRALSASQAGKGAGLLRQVAADSDAGLYRQLASSRVSGGRPRFARQKPPWPAGASRELPDLLDLPAPWTATAEALASASAWEDLTLLLEHVRRQSPRSFSVRYGLSRAYDRQGHHQAALAIAEGMADEEKPLDGARPELLARLLYPAPYQAEFLAECGRRKVSPYLALAIAREESRFQPDNRSWADARGLMQVIPSTGDWIAPRAGLKGYSADRLYEPAVNIALGVWYLAYLLERYAGYGSPEILAMAAYNGGPGNVSKWLKQFGDRPLDEFVERIPLEETRFYVKKVSASLLAYERLYGRAQESKQRAGRKSARR
ncbi:MAG: transglycosylase SLT domain-containing protein [Candidatus Wallbacteria bacterium]|nr:transglycosylase SLT domain-containing protein [Candidatus Wallbacteria bacterium]